MFTSKNKKGQAVMVGFMVFTMLLVALLAIIPLLKSEFQRSRDVGGLDCTNTSISTGTKATCVVVDWGFPYFVAIVIAGAASYVTGKRLGFF